MATNEQEPFARKPPRDEVAERALLGCCMLEPAAFEAVSGELSAGDFYWGRNALVWTAIAVLREMGQPADTVLVRGQLERTGKLQAAGGDEYLLALTDTIPLVEHAEAYAKRVRDLSVMRGIIRTCHEIAAEGYGPVEDTSSFCERAGRAIAEATERRSDALNVRSLGDELKASIGELHQRAANADHVLGHRSGFHALDNMINGFVPGDLVILAGRPGMGKTAFANAIKIGVAKHSRKPVLSIELEMTAEQICHRALASDSGIPLGRILRARFEPGDFPALEYSVGELSKLPIYFSDERAVTVSQVRRAARALARARGPLGLISIDYLQLANADRERDNRERELAEASKALKGLAGEMDCPVLCLSALNRKVEDRQTKRPELRDLRESGAIEQDADKVLFIYRDEVYNAKSPDAGLAEIIVAKHRMGAMGTIKLVWSGKLVRFDNLESHVQEPLPV